MLGPRRSARGCALAASACLGTLAVFASPASAGTIRYDAAPSPAYSVDNDQGILKLTFNSCATAGSTQTVGFTLDTEVTGKGSGTGTFKVMKSDGGSLSFDPPQIALAPGRQQTRVNVTIATPSPTAKGAFFRFKIDPENGIGIGQGPGVMIRIACVLDSPARLAPADAPVACPQARRHPNPNDAKDGDPTDGNAGRGNDGRPAPAPTLSCAPSLAPAQAQPACPPQARAARTPNPNDAKDGDPTDGNAGRGNDGRDPAAPQAPAPAASAAPSQSPAPAPACGSDAPADGVAGAPAAPPATFAEASISSPTAGVFAPLSARSSAASSRCVATPRRLRVRKGERTELALTVRTNGVAIRGAAVRVVGAGVRKVAHTGKDGSVVVAVTPTRTGVLALQSDVCFGVDRMHVLAAKAASSGSIAPAFTG